MSGRIWALSLVLVFTLGAAGGAWAEPPKLSFEQAMAAVAAKIAKGRKNLDRMMASSGSGKEGKSAGTVEFQLEVDPKGQGKASTSKRCFGVTLRCKAQIIKPLADFDVQVNTDAGSKYQFERLKSKKVVNFDLQTNSGFSSTEFVLKVKSAEPGVTGPVLIAMDYDY